MAAIAIITARGGSKRIPRKNVRIFAGRPMIEWPITAALDSGMFERVLVSTDDAEIAEVATRAGAEAPFVRPAELSDDHAGTLEVVGHATGFAAARGWSFDAACCLYGTSAFITADDLRRAFDRLSSNDWNYVFAAGRFARPAQRAFLRDREGAMQLMLPQLALARSQDLPPTFFDAGQFYWGTRQAWAERRPIYGDRTTFIESPASRAIDIDTPEDWALAERQFSEWKR